MTTTSFDRRRFLRGLATRSRYRQFVLRSSNEDRVFAKTLLRLWVAYETKSMRYGIFTAIKDRQRQTRS